MDTQGQSEFNMAFSYLGRLNVLLYYCDNYAMELNAHGWFHTLLSVYRELSTYIDETDMEYWNERRGTINALLIKNESQNRRKGGDSIHPELYSELHEFELFLRKIMKKTGIQMRMESNPERAIK